MTQPYVEDGEVLCVHNQSSRTIHPLAPAEYETVTGETRRQSVCGRQSLSGGAYSETALIRVSVDAFEGGDEYYVDDGEVVGKFCGNCLMQMTPPE